MKKIVLILVLIVALAACSDFGTKLQYGKSELYYTEKISADEAKRVGDFLVTNHWITDGQRVSYQLDKEAQNYVFKLVLADEQYTQDKEYLNDIQILGGFLSHDALNNQPVEMWLCNNQFEPLYKVGYKQLSDSLLQKAREEDLENGIQPMIPESDPLPKDNVAPYDTSKGQPA